MTPTEIEELEKRIKLDYYQFKKPFLMPKVIGIKGNLPYRQNRFMAMQRHRQNDPLWKQAFEEYNKANPDNPMHTGCSPCFAKILMWHKKQNNEHPE